jgi:hypothetical protein
MNWILLPETTVTELLGDPVARNLVALQLPNDLPPAFRLNLAKTKQYLGRVIKVNEVVSLLVIWPAKDPQPVILKGMPIVSIWSEADRPSIWVSETRIGPRPASACIS